MLVQLGGNYEKDTQRSKPATSGCGEQKQGTDGHFALQHQEGGGQPPKPPLLSDPSLRSFLTTFKEPSHPT